MNEQTVVLVKPDGVRRGIVGEILSRFERVGLKVVAMKMVWVDEKFVGKHYRDDAKWYQSVGERLLKFYEENGKDPGEDLGTKDPIELGKKVRKWLFTYITSGPVVALLLQAPHAVELTRKLVGETYPLTAAPGTIRGDYHYDSPFLSNLSHRSVQNLVHASGSKEEALFEKKLWFKKEEIYSY
ncbi:MAG: nucleoside-diphosphate kinase [Patescibacteria group bacterium]